MVMRIPLGRSGRFALVDDEDYLRVSALSWHLRVLSNGVELVRNGVHVVRNGRRTTRHILLHRFILGAARGAIIDHANGDGLDNRRANIRICSHRQNTQNRRPHKGRIYKGTRLCGRRYGAQIYVNGKTKRLGSFSTEIEAALAYDTAAKQFFGEFARLNFPIHAEASHAPVIENDDRGSVSCLGASLTP